MPEPEVAFKILALNTEKAHNVKEKSLETIRMARALAARRDGQETDFAFEFEQAQFLTLGAAYEQSQEPERRRLHVGASAHRQLPRRIDGQGAQRARTPRQQGAGARRRGVESRGGVESQGPDQPYLKAFVVARVNPIRFSKSTEFDFDEVIDKMTASAKKFNVEKVKQEDVAKAGGGGARRTTTRPSTDRTLRTVDALQPFRRWTVYVR